MRRELVGAGLATAVLVGGAFVGSAAMAQTGGGNGSTKVATAAADPVKKPDAARERASRFAPSDVVTEGGVSRVFGKNKYATAVAVATAYGWDETNTIAVYIASTQDFPDALALGPSMLGDGPLLLVGKEKVPSDTAKALTALQPCFIDVVGGPAAVNDAVFKELQKYADPTLCDVP